MEDLGPIGEAAVAVMEAIGAPGVGLLLAAEAFFPPIPSEVILPLAGFSAQQGVLPLTAALVWSTVGSLVGALTLYAAGRGLGRERALVAWSRLPLVDEVDFERAERWFDDHGRAAVFLGRFMPLIRSLVSVPAGVARMRLVWFVPLTLVGSLAWNSLFILGGYALGREWHRVAALGDWLQYVVLAGVLVTVVVLVVRRRRR